MSGSNESTYETLLVEIDSGSERDKLSCGSEQQGRMLERSQRLFSLLLNPKNDRQSTLNIDLKDFFTKDVSNYFDPAVAVTLLRNLGREETGVDRMGVEEYSKYCNAIWCFRVVPSRIDIAKRVWAKRQRFPGSGQPPEKYSVVKNAMPWPLPLNPKAGAIAPSLWCWNQTACVSRETAQRLANISLVLGWDQVFQREIKTVIWDWKDTVSTQADLGTPLDCLKDNGTEGLEARRRKELEKIRAFFEDYIKTPATPTYVRVNMRSKLDNATEYGNVYSWMRSVQAVCWKSDWGNIKDWGNLDINSSVHPIRVQTNSSVATQHLPSEIGHNRPISPKGDLFEYVYQKCTGAEKKKVFVVTMLQKANERISQEQKRVAEELMAWRTAQVDDWEMSILPVASGRTESLSSLESPSSPVNINGPDMKGPQARGEEVDNKESSISRVARGSITSSNIREKQTLPVNSNLRDMPDSSRRGQAGDREVISSPIFNGSMEMMSSRERQSRNVRELEDGQTSRRQSKMASVQSTM